VGLCGSHESVHWDIGLDDRYTSIGVDLKDTGEICGTDGGGEGMVGGTRAVG
jgi:hypothetical protein